MNRFMMSALLLTCTALAQTDSTTTSSQTATPAQTNSSQSSAMPMPAVVTADAANKTVQVAFTAGHGTNNNGLNYNGDAKGTKTLTVPLGWTVEVSLANEGRMPHDFAVIAASSVPANVGTARLAFPNAATSIVTPGSAAQTTKFTANRPGTYLILCRVGRHAQNGMYVKLTVTNSVKTATYQ